jgi:hypothetical protein
MKILNSNSYNLKWKFVINGCRDFKFQVKVSTLQRNDIIMLEIDFFDIKKGADYKLMTIAIFKGGKYYSPAYNQCSAVLDNIYEVELAIPWGTIKSFVENNLKITRVQIVG